MENFNVSGVSGTPNAGTSYELKKQEEQKMGAIPMTSGGGQFEQVANKSQDFNVYGKDIANFDKFKGNDKNDAMRLTNSAANDVKKAYMQLQHEFPGLALQFEPMPDPQKCGKKREGFFNYQQQLSNWKDIALTQIANERERSTQELVHGAAGAIIDNDNVNAAMNAGVTIAASEAVTDNVIANAEKNTEKIIENDNRNAAGINANIDREGAATRSAVHTEGKRTRRANHDEAVITRNTVREEGYKSRQTTREEAVDIRNTVREEAAETRETTRNIGKQTQEIGALTTKISDILNSYPHTNATKKSVGEMRDSIINSDLSHDEKVAMLNDLANFSDQFELTSRELRKKRIEIDERVQSGITGESEASQKEKYQNREPLPFYEPPSFKNPFDDKLNGSSSSSTNSAHNTRRYNQPQTMVGSSEPKANINPDKTEPDDKIKKKNN